MNPEENELNFEDWDKFCEEQDEILKQMGLYEEFKSTPVTDEDIANFHFVSTEEMEEEEEIDE